ncbi:MAG: hypothetical protein AUG44_12445 [Actinobacteria bacterium 13_1_20CM_3_71_11]|nr:MAG: hypothetical protein AUG44_12445 [Actinobacteria bacterium 13_1_20CM_3_71_11]TML25659.1 MAG: hypothetical protein E6G35_11870 [Actinomycetota bacterium]
MRDWIAGAMTVLGTLLVFSGAAIIISRTWFNRPPAEEATAPTPAYGVSEKTKSLMRLSPPDRLIAWGILLLVLAAIAAGAIGLEFGANAPAK